MKTAKVKWLGRVALMAVFTLFFTQCENAEQVLPFHDDNAAIVDRGNGDFAKDICNCYMTNFPKEVLSESEIAALIYMREEEKLARDVYLKMEELWNARVFTNIARSEQRHMDAVKCILDKYELPDVAASSPQGTFENPTLQELYNTLTESGRKSLADALITGATIEDLDIYDIMQYENDEKIDNADIRQVFENLTRGSRNHLRAFTRNLESLNTYYTPQYISSDVYEAIITTEWEKGQGICSVCKGTGNKNKPGPGNCGNCGGPGWGNPNKPGNGTGNCPQNSNLGQAEKFKKKRRNQ